MHLDDYIDALPNPLETIEKLNQYVIGQDIAKKNLSVLLLVRALMRLQKNGRIPQDVEIQKSNLLLIGPTGSGKTELIRALSEIADIPILIKDVTGITSAGYIGGKVEDILVEYITLVENYIKSYKFNAQDSLLEEPEVLYQDLFLDTLETGIIYLDEIDKLLATGDKADITGNMVQNELLKMLEGNTLKLINSKLEWPRSGHKELNTKYITFICGGAFSGLSEIVHTRLTKASGIGFNSSLNHYNIEKHTSELLLKVTTDDLLKYGFKAEFLGRLPLKAVLNELTLPVMMQIITEPKNAIYKRYQAFFKLFNIELAIDKQGVKEIAQRAIELKMGARSLHQIFNTLFIEDLANVFNLKNSILTLSKVDVIKRLK